MTRRAQGFSLAELLISFLILSLMLISILTMIPIVLSGINQATQRAEASALSRQILEQLRVQGAQGMVLGGPAPQPALSLNGLTFQILYEVSDCGFPRDIYVNDPSRNYMAYQVDVYVYWGDGPNSAGSKYQVSSQIGRTP